ncbi:MAG: hypothetical protein GX375_03685 [Clostridiales bacterium]|nr:hypothetical protein [Clostridiales bacterium]
MRILKTSGRSYGIYKVGNKHRVVRNIKDFDTFEEASKTALRLARGDIREEDLLLNQDKDTEK